METYIDNMKVNYEIVGEGDVILMLHGWGGCIDSMRPIINHYKDKFKVVSVDFPGHGESGNPGQAWDVDNYCTFLKKFLEQQIITKMHIIAHSFGGRVSILFASKYPEMVEKLVLADSGGIKPKRKIKYYIKVYSYKFIKNFLKVVLLNSKAYNKAMNSLRARVGSSDYKQLSEAMRGTFVKVVNQDLRPYLKGIKAPTLLIWGENDADTPVNDGKIMEQEIPDAGLVVLKNAGHFVYLDKATEFNIIVEKFLEVK